MALCCVLSMAGDGVPDDYAMPYVTATPDYVRTR